MPPLLQFHFLVVLLAFTAVLGRLMEIAAPSIVLWRTALAGLLMWTWLAAVAPLRRLPRRMILPVLGVGCLLGAHWIGFFWSIDLANISIALAAFGTVSAFTALTEPLIFRRRVRSSELITGGIVIVGILLIAGCEGGALPGLIVGLASALLAATFPVLNRLFMIAGHSSRTLLLYELAGAFLVSGLFIALVPGFRFEVPGAADWLPLLALAVLCTVVAHTWHIQLLRRITAFQTNLIMNFEPVWGILFGAVLFSEHKQLHPAFYAGALLIITANFLDPLLRSSSIKAGLES